MENTAQQTESGPVMSSLELENVDEYSRFLLHSRNEILDVLRTLIRKASLITVHFDQGRSFLLTALLGIGPDNERIFLDPGCDEAMNQRALQAKKLILTAQVDKVKVQFALDGLSAVHYEQRPAFSSYIPLSILRLQRREFFRLSMPIAEPVSMFSAIRLHDGNTLNLEIPLFDISCGGVGLMVEPSMAELLSPGDVLHDCRIMLPGDALLNASLQVRNKFAVMTRTGYHFVRMGCEFLNLPAAKSGLVQRYIIRVERERKARLSGLT